MHSFFKIGAVICLKLLPKQIIKAPLKMLKKNPLKVVASKAVNES
jgi:hypothetical protein